MLPEREQHQDTKREQSAASDRQSPGRSEPGEMSVTPEPSRKTVTIEVEANPAPPRREIRCGFGHRMEYSSFNFVFNQNGTQYSVPNLPAYICRTCGVKILIKEVGDELIKKVSNGTAAP